MTGSGRISRALGKRVSFVIGSTLFSTEVWGSKCMQSIQATAGGSLTHMQCRTIYWPPPVSNRSRLIELPSGKKVFVFNIKRDEDGELEPAVVFLDPNFTRKGYLQQEEWSEFLKLVPRLRQYFDLWELKADQVREDASKPQQSEHTEEVPCTSFIDD